MIWACFSSKGVGAFLRIRGKLVKEKYRQIFIHHASCSTVRKAPNRQGIYLSTRQRSKTHCHYRQKVLQKQGKTRENKGKQGKTRRFEADGLIGLLSHQTWILLKIYGAYWTTLQRTGSPPMKMNFLTSYTRLGRKFTLKQQQNLFSVWGDGVKVWSCEAVLANHGYPTKY